MLMPTMIAGGESPNSIPANSTLTIDRRLLPNESGDAVRAQIAAAVERVGREEGVEIDPDRACAVRCIRDCS
jgi:acetylornithine deacetylase/succinyl-diaminopimelate desuccinylase-like protein